MPTPCSVRLADRSGCFSVLFLSSWSRRVQTWRTCFWPSPAQETPKVATRAALGTSRRRLARQFLIESLMLALAGGLGGVIVARWTTNLLIAFGAQQLPRERSLIRLDGVRVSAPRLRGDGAVLRPRAGADSRPRRSRVLRRRAAAGRPPDAVTAVLATRSGSPK